jgi:hypothetical protein
VIKAVRASAAFPPAIPPISLPVKTTWAYEYGMKMDDVPVRPSLTDGGAFNNFGTEWHQLRNELHIFQNAFFRDTNREDQIQDEDTWYRERYGQVQLIADASRLDQGTGLAGLHLPVIGFIKYFLRTISVLYGSTLAGRSRSSEAAASFRMKSYHRKWLARHSGSKTFKYSFQYHPKPYDSEFDQDSIEHGALRLYVFHWRPFNYIQDFWQGLLPRDTKGDYQRMVHWVNGNRLAAERMTPYWPWTGDTEQVKPQQDEVPTTFRKLGRDTTLKLILEGYLKTREVLRWSFGHEGPPMLDLSTFNAIVGSEPRLCAWFGACVSNLRRIMLPWRRPVY